MYNQYKSARQFISHNIEYVIYNEITKTINLYVTYTSVTSKLKNLPKLSSALSYLFFMTPPNYDV